MSYPSVTTILDDLGIRAEDATPSQLDAVLLEAFATDLPDGFAFLTTLSADAHISPERQVRTEDPSSLLGRQLTRLVGTDVARDVLERHFGIAFGLYNCCTVIAATSREGLTMSPLEQIQLQNGTLALANC